MGKMFYIGWILLAMILSVVDVVNADFHLETAKLQVQIPESLQKTGGYTIRRANFGKFPKGRSGVHLRHQLFYPYSCSCSDDETSSLCQKSSYSSCLCDRQSDRQSSSCPNAVAPFILMMRLTTSNKYCNIATMARTAQAAGASSLIIIIECTATSEEKCNWNDPKLYADWSRDDYWSHDITIPSFLVSSQEVGPILKYLQDGKKQIMLDIGFYNSTMSPPVVSYSFWSTPGDQASDELFSDFASTAMELGPRASFTPRFLIFHGDLYGCRERDGQRTNEEKEKCGSLCTNNGRYCASPPDGLYPTITGSDVVAESLRRICIWSQHGSDGVGSKWWNYVRHHTEKCHDAEKFSSSECVKDSYAHANIDGNAVELCMQYTGGLEKDNDNTMLDPEIQAQQNSIVMYSPSVLVDQILVSDVSDVFAYICSEYPRGTEPQICSLCATCSQWKDCVQAGGLCPIPSHSLPRNSPTPIMSPAAEQASRYFLASCICVAMVFIVFDQYRLHIRRGYKRKTHIELELN